MGLTSLEIHQFRNLHQVNIDLDAGLNLIVGKNAAGKTSLLEAIFYLSYGRSFRNTQAKNLIQHESDFFRLITTIDNTTRIGIERNKDQQQIRVNYQTVSKLSRLSSLLPIIALHPDSHQLISAGPEHRRQFLDWGVFHVEHQFLDSWRKYKIALKQRNAALRMMQDDGLCALWNSELLEHALIIQSSRQNYLKSLQAIIVDLSKELFPELDVNLSYKQGWPADLEYSDYLTNHIKKDKEKGFTQAGPHRADLKITVNGQSAQSSISRGQQKKLVCLLKIAQLVLFSRNTQKHCILLFDDLPAELDIDNQNKILSILSRLDIQLIVTAIEAEQIEYKHWESYKVFHVEHGVIEEKFN